MDYKEELYHYGILGMKWGVRRYETASGHLTEAGKQRYLGEYKNDKKVSYEKRRAATLYGKAYKIAAKKASRSESKLEKAKAKDTDSSKKRTQRLQEDYDKKAATANSLQKAYTKRKNDAERHCKSMIDKYGKDSVKSIKYDKDGYINERTSNGKDYALMALKDSSSLTLANAVNSPLMVKSHRRTTNSKAREIAKAYAKDPTITDYNPKNNRNRLIGKKYYMYYRDPNKMD